MKLSEKSWALFVGLVFCVTSAFAQDQKQGTSPADPNAPLQTQDANPSGGHANQPIGAARGVAGPSESQPYDPSQVSPDTNTLAGAEFFTVGSLEHSHNIFDPFLSTSVLGDYFPGIPGQSSLGAVSIVGGGLNFNRNWSRYRLTASYNGGETIAIGNAPLFAGQNSSYSQFHDLSFIQGINWARWHVLLRDDFIASPGAAFTGTGMGGPGLIGQYSSTLGASLSNIGQAFAPVQTIETGYAMRYMDSVLGQAEYSISRQSTLTFSGSYGLLHFANAGFVSSNMVSAQAGYDYLLDPRNSIAILGGYGKIDYPGTGESTTDYTASLAYGRKITGRLAFQAAGGPQEIQAAGAGVFGSFRQLSFSINSALTYQWRRSGLSFSYMHGLTAGSGVFLGATSDTFSASGYYRFTRFWTGSVNGGYAFNRSLAPAGGATSNFENWFIGANIGRQVGRHLQVNFNYGLQEQTNPSVCPVSSCGAPGYQHTFGMTVNWHLRPVPAG